MPDLAVMNSRPASNVILQMMEQCVHTIQLRTNRRAIVCVLGIVDELRDLHQLIAFGICFAKAVVVLIIVVQVQKELVGQFFQSAGQIIDMGKATELHNHRLADNASRSDRRCPRRVVVATTVVMVCVVVIAVMRNDVGRVLMHDVVMIPANHMSVRISDDVVVVIDVIARTVVIPGRAVSVVDDLMLVMMVVLS